MTTRNVIILGTGPAGLTAGLYLGRANLAPLIFSGALPGGQLTTTTEVENFPGFPEGRLGGQLMLDMEEQAKKFGAEVVNDVIDSADLSTRPFTLKAGSGETFSAHTIIIATGASPRLLGLPTEQTFWNYGVHTCAVCDGGFYRGKEVVVVGGGDSAMEEATYLAKLCNKVTVVHRRRELRASKIMAERALAHPKLAFEWDAAVDEVKGSIEGNKKRVTAVVLRDVNTGARREVATNAMFVAIGHVPNAKFLGGQVATDDEGYIKIDHDQQTNIEGVFAAGDIHDRHFRQAITAAGFGCMAALSAERYLTRQGLGSA